MRRRIVRLDVALMHHRGVEFTFDDNIRFGEPFLDVARLKEEVLCDVGRLVVSCFGRRTDRCGADLIIQDRRIVLHCVEHVQYRRQRFVLNLDQLACFLGDVHRIGSDGSDRVPAIKHLIASHHIGGQMPHVRGAFA